MCIFFLRACMYLILHSNQVYVTQEHTHCGLKSCVPSFRLWLFLSLIPLSQHCSRNLKDTLWLSICGNIVCHLLFVARSFQKTRRVFLLSSQSSVSDNVKGHWSTLFGNSIIILRCGWWILYWDWQRTWRSFFFDHWHCHEGALVEDGGTWSWFQTKQLDVHFDKFVQFSKSSDEHCFFKREVLQKTSIRQKWIFRNAPNFFWSNGPQFCLNTGHVPVATQTCQGLPDASLHHMKMMSFLSGPRWKKKRPYKVT